MASLLLKGVHKRLGLSNLSCSSADATNVVTGRAIDRHSPRLRDPSRLSSASRPPRAKASPSSSPKPHDGSKRSKSGAAAGRPSEKRLVSPATSSRFLLNSSRLQSDDVNVAELALPPPAFVDAFPRDADMAAAPVPFAEEAPPLQLAESSGSSVSSSSEITAVDASAEHEEEKKAAITRSCSTRTQGQVVVLRVSLHCKGCAGKVKKHIAMMEGVTSFDIDIATKKVTVVGDVTPLGVLNSVSKVKAAQFWPSPSQPPRASASY